MSHLSDLVAANIHTRPRMSLPSDCRKSKVRLANALSTGVRMDRPHLAEPGKMTGSMSRLSIPSTKFASRPVAIAFFSFLSMFSTEEAVCPMCLSTNEATPIDAFIYWVIKDITTRSSRALCVCVHFWEGQPRLKLYFIVCVLVVTSWGYFLIATRSAHAFSWTVHLCMYSWALSCRSGVGPPSSALPSNLTIFTVSTITTDTSPA